MIGLNGSFIFAAGQKEEQIPNTNFEARHQLGLSLLGNLPYDLPAYMQLKVRPVGTSNNVTMQLPVVMTDDGYDLDHGFITLVARTSSGTNFDFTDTYYDQIWESYDPELELEVGSAKLLMPKSLNVFSEISATETEFVFKRKQRLVVIYFMQVELSGRDEPQMSQVLKPFFRRLVGGIAGVNAFDGCNPNKVYLCTDRYVPVTDGLRSLSLSYQGTDTNGDPHWKDDVVYQPNQESDFPAKLAILNGIGWMSATPLGSTIDWGVEYSPGIGLTADIYLTITK